MRKKRRTSTKKPMERLLMVMISILTSAMMLVGIGIIAEVRTSDPEPVEELPVEEAHAEPAQDAEPEVPAQEDSAPEAPVEDSPAELPEEAASDISAEETEDSAAFIAHSPEPTEPIEEPEEPPEETESPPNTVSEATEPPALTEEPTECPSETLVPTHQPTVSPTETPVVCPTEQPAVTQPPEGTIAPTDAPTTEPTLEPTLAPTSEPQPAAYSLYIISPSGWHLEKASVTLRLIDQNNIGYKSVMVRINGDGAWVDVTDRFLGVEDVAFEISENCTLYVAVTDPYGNAHTAHRYVQCFDRENPVVRGAIEGEMLRVEAKDNLSGVAAIMVCGHRFTDFTNGVMDIRLREYADNYKQISIQAEDYVGNLSETKMLKNPYYDPKLPTPKPTATPVPTLIPTAAPQEPSGSGGGGSNSNTNTASGNTSGASGSGNGSSHGGNSATSTPIPTLIPTNEPSGTLLPTLFPTNEPTATPFPTETPEPIAMEVTGDVPPTIEPGTGFSTTGNAVARDLLYDKHTNKQFILMQTREGASYYIIIDYDKPLDEDGESYETYFLNMVDARDLFDLVPEEDRPEEYVPTPTPMPTDIPLPTTEPTPEPPEETPEPEMEPAQAQDGNTTMMAGLALLLVAGGGALWFFKLRKPKGAARDKELYEDYDPDEDDDDDYGDDDEELDEEDDGMDGDDE